MLNRDRCRMNQWRSRIRIDFAPASSLGERTRDGRPSAHRASHAQQPAACRIVVSRRPYHAERQHLSRQLPVSDSRKLRDGRGLTCQGEPTANRHQRQNVIPADLLGLDVRVVPEAREVRNQIIVDFLAWRNIADNEALARQIGPAKFGLVRQRMLFGQNDEDPLAPQMFRLTAIPGSRSRHECNVQIQLPDGGDVLGRISITDFHPDVRMKLPELAQEIEQKARCERRKYPDLETPLLNPADCRHLGRANVNLAKSTSGASEEFLPATVKRTPAE